MASRKQEMIFKQMTDNIDETLPIVSDKASSFSFNSCIFTGKRLNRGAGLRLEILVMYQARGHEKAFQWLEKTITKILLHVDDFGSKFKSKEFLRNIYFLNK